DGCSSDLITRLLAPGEGEPGLKDELGELGAAWIKDGRGAQEGLSKGLMGEFLALVTADL
ncbi:hypothetical protein IIA79_02690, partial [bacterium]|nr:hypothetical protein [bacterium]